MVTKLIRLFLILILSLGGSLLHGQQVQRRAGAPPLSERIFFGGNFGLQIGTYTYIEASPLVGLWLLPRVAVAAGPSYKFIKDPLGSTDVWGGKSYIRLIVVNDISTFIPIGMQTSLFLHSEFEGLSYRSDFFLYNYDSERVFIESIFAGVGVSQKIGVRGSVSFSVLWVLNDSEFQIYDNPELRVGFTF